MLQNMAASQLIASKAQKGVKSSMSANENTWTSLWGRAAKAATTLLLAVALAATLMACQNGDDAASAENAGESTSSGSASATEQTSAAPILNVVATSNIAADWARNVGGDRVEVKGLLPIGADPHSYQPGPRDVADVAAADLVLTIGHGLEDEWFRELVHNASADESRIVALAEHVSPIEFEEAGDHAMEEGEGGELVGRLLIADGSEPRVSVLDLETGDVELHALEVAAASATLYSSPSGRFVYAISRGPEENDDRVQIFDGGVYLDEHGDHFDLVVDPVSELTLGTTDQRPVHVAVHEGQTAIFHDATGRVAVFDEHELEEERNAYEPVWLETGLQHGAVVPLGEEYVAVTSNNPDYPETATSSLPIGAEVRTLDDTVVYDASNRACPSLHGEAANHHGVMFGCAGGVLFIEGHDGEFSHVFIPNDSSMNEAARIGTVWAHEDAEMFLGSATYRNEDGARVNGGLWAIDAEGESMSRVLPAADDKLVLRAAFDGHGERVFVLTYDGTLNVIDTEPGDVLEVIELLEPFDGDTSPTFTTVGDLLYLTDRANGRLIEFSMDHGEVEREWSLGGEPRSVAFAGIGGGEAHEEEGHEEEGHDHHHHGTYDPHFWFDPPRVKTAVDLIAERLSALDPAGAATYRANAAAYAAELDALHAWTESIVNTLPVERRVLVTSHDSFRYFADLYGFRVVGTVLPGLSPDIEPSAQHLHELVETLEEHPVPAVFGETTVSERLAQSIASETDSRFQRIYSGSLGPAGSGAETYIGMVRSNVGIIIGALR